MAIHHLDDPGDLVAPALIAALDGWIDAGLAATTAAAQIAGSGPVVATFERDLLFDYRSRRPTLEIVDGRPTELTWPEFSLRRARIDERDLLILAKAEPDFRWEELSAALVEIARTLGVVEWISLGAIPAAVPHTRTVPILGTSSQPGLLPPEIRQGPDGLLRVPAAAVSVLDVAASRAGIAAVGFFAQVPHYVSGAYPEAALELLRTVGHHLGVDLPLGELPTEARQMRIRLDAATAADEATRSYVERLESMVDESRLPSGDDLISEIERFLRDRGTGSEPTERGERG